MRGFPGKQGLQAPAVPRFERHNTSATLDLSSGAPSYFDGIQVSGKYVDRHRQLGSVRICLDGTTYRLQRRSERAEVHAPQAHRSVCIVPETSDEA